MNHYIYKISGWNYTKVVLYLPNLKFQYFVFLEDPESELGN